MGASGKGCILQLPKVASSLTLSSVIKMQEKLTKLPISVIIPTYNSMSLLERHVQSVNKWSDLVEEVIVIDSHSTDGTVEYLRANLLHSDVQFLVHPPGLYESWNSAINEASAAFIYVSTIGDTISRGGIEGLYRTLESFSADLVISPPRILEADLTTSQKQWPIHRLLKKTGREQPFVLEADMALAWHALSFPYTLVGSSASNLYRSSILKSKKFPLNYGRRGDTAWAIEYLCEFQWVVDPTSYATFVRHPKAELGDESTYALLLKLADLSMTTVERIKDEVADSYSLLSSIYETHKEHIKLKQEAAVHRKRRLPWYLYRSAWASRGQRKKIKRLLQANTSVLLNKIK